MRRFALFVFLVVFLVACSSPIQSPNATPAPSGDGGEKVISYAAWEGDRARFEALAQTFMEQNPDIKITIVALDDIVNVQSSQPTSDFDLLRRLVSVADTAPNVFNTRLAFGTNLLTDLRPLMDADPNFKRDDFYPGALEQASGQGGTWILPRTLAVQVLTYNKDLFQMANLPEPQLDWTWTDALAVAEQLASQRGSTVETYGMFEPSGGFLPLMELLRAQNIDLLSIPPQELQLDRPEIVAAVERLRNLYQSGALLQPYQMEGPGLDVTQLVRDGQVAMWPASMLPVEEYSFTLGTASFPPSVAGVEFWTGSSVSEGYIISGGTANPDAAWKWIEFLSRQQPDQFVDSGFSSYSIPARRSIADASGFWTSLDETTASVYQQVIANAGDQSAGQPDMLMFNNLMQVMAQAINSTSDPARALAEAQQQFQNMVAQAQLTPTATPDTSPVVVATPEPQEAPAGAVAVKFAMPGYLMSSMRGLVRTFNQENPEYFVQLVSTDVLTRTNLSDMASFGDCFAAGGLPQSTEDVSALLDLQPLMDADADSIRADYPDALLAVYRNGGKLLGLPYAFNVRTINYNRTVFDQVGVGQPTYTWTPDDFLKAAQALSSGNGEERTYGYVARDIISDLFFFVGQFGGRITTGSGIDARPNFDDPQVVEALQWYLDLYRVHNVMPPMQFAYNSQQVIEDRSFELIQNGRAGMWFDYGYGTFGGNRERPIDGPGGQPQVNFEVGVSPLPLGRAGLRGEDVYPRGFFISAQTQQPQACWEWLKFLSTDLSQLYGEIPARLSVQQSEAFAQQSPPEVLALVELYAEPLQRAVSQSESSGNAITSGSVESYWLLRALSRALEDDADLQQELREAQRFTTLFMECVAQGSERPACAKEADPTYDGWLVEAQG